MGKLGYIARMGEPDIQRIVNGCIKSAIDAHGPITTANYGSASKRIAAQLVATVRQLIAEEKAARGIDSGM